MVFPETSNNIISVVKRHWSCSPCWPWTVLRISPDQLRVLLLCFASPPADCPPSHPPAPPSHTESLPQDQHKPPLSPDGRRTYLDSAGCSEHQGRQRLPTRQNQEGVTGSSDLLPGTLRRFRQQTASSSTAVAGAEVRGYAHGYRRSVQGGHLCACDLDRCRLPRVCGVLSVVCWGAV